jgi:hypothetical protein
MFRWQTFTTPLSALAMSSGAKVESRGVVSATVDGESSS